MIRGLLRQEADEEDLGFVWDFLVTVAVWYSTTGPAVTSDRSLACSSFSLISREASRLKVRVGFSLTVNFLFFIFFDYDLAVVTEFGAAPDDDLIYGRFLDAELARILFVPLLRILISS